MARQKNHVQNIKDKAAVARQNEKIINDILLQFAYTLTIGVISIFMFNALTYRNGYDYSAYVFANKFSWFAFAVTLVLGILFAALYIIKKNNKYKIICIYLFVTSAVSFWYVGVQEIVHRLPFLKNIFSGNESIILCIFPLLGIALVVEFAVYFIRYYKINKRNKK